MTRNNNMEVNAEVPTFFSFLFRNKTNRRLLTIAMLVGLAQFILFKILYPFADYFSDSYWYIYAASANLDISIWPIGYSKFLRFFHELTHSDLAVVAFQYFFLELSCVYFYFTLLYFYNPARVAKYVIFAFLFINPLFLYISNYINSDPLFAALSVLWLTELLWIFQRPSPYHLFFNGLLLFFAFTVRNNAYYYPLISILAFLLCRQQLRVKIAAIGLSTLLIAAFIFQTRDAAYKLTGKRQFSLFTGWQLANNALYMYGNIKIDSNRLPSTESKTLDRFSRAFYKTVPANFNSYLSEYVANFFIREPESPLKQYFNNRFQTSTEHDLVVAWGKAAITYDEYGKWLIEHYPLQYGKDFMLLNAKNFFLPPLEKLEIYNLGLDHVNPSAQDWFDYKTPAVTSVSKDIQGKILLIFPFAFCFINILCIGSTIWLLYERKRVTLPRELKHTLYLLSSLLVLNFGFCVSATIIVLRYQFFPMIVTLTLFLLLMEALERRKLESQQITLASKDRNINSELASA